TRNLLFPKQAASHQAFAPMCVPPDGVEPTQSGLRVRCPDRSGVGGSRPRNADEDVVGYLIVRVLDRPIPVTARQSFAVPRECTQRTRRAQKRKKPPRSTFTWAAFAGTYERKGPSCGLPGAGPVA